MGITPADAGKTLRIVKPIEGYWDHPRGCGENQEPLRRQTATRGSPPRMRGKPSLYASANNSPRITPADAGKTRAGFNFRCVSRDHPRGCGENSSSKTACRLRAGSPPRMRGKHSRRFAVITISGITPADAGKTCVPPYKECKKWDHPRGCGENRRGGECVCGFGGSPPRMRGKLLLAVKRERYMRITPADAGKTGSSRSQAMTQMDHPRGCGENTATNAVQYSQ